MRRFRTRVEDSTFELNLAPMLDIIVSIVPMLLLSVVFVRITTIETPIPQAVEKAMVEAQEKNKDILITLSVSKDSGFTIAVNNRGQNHEAKVALKDNKFDLDGLHKEVVTLKKQFPDVFRLEIHPEENVPLNEIVSVMDQVRTRGKDDPKIFFNDASSGKQIETDLLFPDVVFGNVAGG